MSSGRLVTDPRTSTFARLREYLSPLLILLLLAQFAPIGLFVMQKESHNCPHCGAVRSDATAHMAGSHAHHGEMHAMDVTGHAATGEPSFCGCGGDDIPFTIVPTISKTMVVETAAGAQRPAHDFPLSAAHASLTSVHLGAPFHPPRSI